MELSFLISGAVGFAQVVARVWSRVNEGQQRQLDREHQLNLQRERFAFAAHIEELRTRTPASDLSDELRRRLEVEATALHRLGYDPIFEPYGEGYGVAVPLSPDDAVAFWLPPSFPDTPPQVLVKLGDAMDEVAFEGSSWSENVFLLADVVEALRRAVPEAIR